MIKAHSSVRDFKEKILVPLLLPVIFCTCHISASRRDLLAKNESKQPSTERVYVNEEDLKAESRIIMPRDYPFNYNDCENNWWTYGAPAKLIKTVAKHIGIHRCINHPRDQIGYMFMVFNKGHLFGGPTYFIRRGTAEVHNVTQLYPHLRDDFCVMVHRIPPERRSITRSFLHDTWAATGTTLMMAAGAMHVAGMRPAWFHALTIFITGGFPESRSARSVVSAATRSALCILLSILSLILTNAFTGMFMTFLTVPHNAHQIDTLAELVEWADRIWVDPMTNDFFHLFNDEEVIRKLNNRSYVYGDFEPNPQRHFLENTRDAFVQSQQVMNQMSFLHSFVGKDGQPLTRIMRECLISPGYIAFPVKKDWYFKDRFDALVQRLVQAGIIDKLERDSIFYIQKAIKQLNKESNVSSPPNPSVGDASGTEPFALEAMWEPGALLGLGLALATVAFLAELLAAPIGILAQRCLWRKEPLSVWPSVPN